ncbi:hypothetical protein ES705_13883 [subsurface metagenome]
MKYRNKSILLFVMIFIFIIISTGCNGSNPIIPEIVNPNPTVNPNNNTVSYVEVSASSSIIKINQSLQFVVKGYNSDDEWVILDKSKIKSWDWSALGCPACYEEFIDLSPKSGSLTTTFSSGKAGTFYIVAYYQENPGDVYITDFTEVIVTK